MIQKGRKKEEIRENESGGEGKGGKFIYYITVKRLN